MTLDRLPWVPAVGSAICTLLAGAAFLGYLPRWKVVPYALAGVALAVAAAITAIAVDRR